jgi:hypothetical protein
MNNPIDREILNELALSDFNVIIQRNSYNANYKNMSRELWLNLKFRLVNDDWNDYSFDFNNVLDNE